MSTQTYPRAKPKPLAFIPATRLQQSFVATAEKKTLLMAGAPHTSLD